MRKDDVRELMKEYVILHRGELFSELVAKNRKKMMASSYPMLSMTHHINMSQCLPSFEILRAFVQHSSRNLVIKKTKKKHLKELIADEYFPSWFDASQLELSHLKEIESAIRSSINSGRMRIEMILSFSQSKLYSGPMMSIINLIWFSIFWCPSHKGIKNYIKMKDCIDFVQSHIAVLMSYEFICEKVGQDERPTWESQELLRVLGCASQSKESKIDMIGPRYSTEEILKVKVRY